LKNFLRKQDGGTANIDSGNKVATKRSEEIFYRGKVPPQKQNIVAGCLSN
jgi:hypothetical protein